MESYEQCYGADFNPEVSLERRQRCWSDWLQNRGETDPPERVRYARMRLEQLAVDGLTRPLPTGDAPEPRPRYEHEYPRSAPGEYQRSGCNPLCADRWSLCNTGCTMKDKTCVAACESEYRVCVDGCP